MRQGKEFKGRQFTAEVILWAVRWYLMFPISYRDLELMLADRGVGVDHTPIFRWIQAYAPELEKRIRPHLRASNGSWRVDETYVKVNKGWMYLYRAVDSTGQTIDFLLTAKHDAASTRRFFRKVFANPANVEPRVINVDKNEMPRLARDGLWLVPPCLANITRYRGGQHDSEGQNQVGSKGRSGRPGAVREQPSESLPEKGNRSSGAPSPIFFIFIEFSQHNRGPPHPVKPFMKVPHAQVKIRSYPISGGRSLRKALAFGHGCGSCQ